MAEKVVVQDARISPLHQGSFEGSNDGGVHSGEPEELSGAECRVVHLIAQSPGSPLDPATRTFMESRFGVDFSSVRVHAGPEASQAASALRARAFTVGRDIHFASGDYRPNSLGGKALLAHELTHVIQQGGVVGASAGGARAAGFSLQRAPAAPTPEFEDCPRGWREMIVAAVRRGQTWVARAVAVLETILRAPATPLPTVHGALIRHFRMDRVPEEDRWSRTIRLLRDFRAIHAGFAHPPFECETSCDPGTRGYVYTGLFGLIRTLSDVHLCPDWFSLPDADRRTVDIIHEIAHKYADKDDIAYEFTPRAYAALTPDEALENADSFGAFARDVR